MYLNEEKIYFNFKPQYLLQGRMYTKSSELNTVIIKLFAIKYGRNLSSLYKKKKHKFSMNVSVKN